MKSTIIVSTLPVNFWKRLFFNAFLRTAIFSLFFGLITFLVSFNLILFLIITLTPALVQSVFTAFQYRYYVYSISSKDDTIYLNYLHWNKNSKIEFNLKAIKIELVDNSHYRNIYKIIAFKYSYDINFAIEPELYKPTFWTEEKLEEVYNKLIGLQTALKNGE